MGYAVPSPYSICWEGSPCPAQFVVYVYREIQCQVRRGIGVRGLQENTMVLWSSRQNCLVKKGGSYWNAHICVLGCFQRGSHLLATLAVSGRLSFRNRQAEHVFGLCTHWIRVTGSPGHLWTQEYPTVSRNVSQHYRWTQTLFAATKFQLI